MDSSATLTTHLHPKPLPTKLDSARKHPPPPSLLSRRTPSFSSSSSTFSPYNSSSSLESVLYSAAAGADDDDGSCPCSPLRFSDGGGGVPFSWEHLPGIPKKQTCFKKKLNFHNQESSMKLLPLPPPTNTTATSFNSTSSYNYRKKNSVQSIFQRDPFYAAMVVCSKGDDDYHGRGGGGGGSNNIKVSRSMSDRLGFVNLYSSCKNASAISESIIYLPSSRRSSRTNYHHFSRRGSL